jgi:hypothetical protein
MPLPIRCADQTGRGNDCRQDAGRQLPISGAATRQKTRLQGLWCNPEPVRWAVPVAECCRRTMARLRARLPILNLFNAGHILSSRDNLTASRTAALIKRGQLCSAGHRVSSGKQRLGSQGSDTTAGRAAGAALAHQGLLWSGRSRRGGRSVSPRSRAKRWAE